MRKLIYILLFIPFVLHAQSTYYMDATDGDDSNTGLSPAQAFQTIDHIENITINAGDSILFKRGEIWRESLTINESGTYGNWLYFGNYGDTEDDLPRIVGSESAISFIAEGTTNIWKAVMNVPHNPDRGIPSEYWDGNLWFELSTGNIEWGYYETYTSGFTNLSDEYDWTWNNDTVYIYSATNPSTWTTSIEIPFRDYCIRTVATGNTNYLHFDGLDLRYAFGRGYWLGYPARYSNGFIFENNFVGYIGVKNGDSAYGIQVYADSAIVRNNTTAHCGRRHICFAPTGADIPFVIHNILIEGNHCYGLYHGTFEIFTGANATCDSAIIRRNLIEGDPDFNIQGEDGSPSNMMYIVNYNPDEVVLSNIYIYNNIYTYIQGKAVYLQDVTGAYVVNNTIYKWNPSVNIAEGMTYVLDGSTDINILNNIIVNDGVATTQDDLYTIRVNTEAVPGTFYDYNLYQVDDPSIIFAAANGTYYRGTYETYKSNNGWDLNSPDIQNPYFVDGDNGDFSLTDSSAASRGGTPLWFVTTDYNGDPRNEYRPSIGAIENDHIDSTSTEIWWYSLPNQVSSTINFSDSSVAIVVPYGTDLSSITPTIVVSTDATINPTSGTSQDYSSTVNHTVTAANGVDSQVWSVNVTNKSYCSTVTIDLNETIYSDTLSGNKGAIELSPSGGTSPYTYLWGGGQTTQNITGLDTDTYTVTVTDDSTCTASGSFFVGNYDPTVVDTIMINLTTSGNLYTGPGAVNVLSTSTIYYSDAVEIIVNPVDDIASIGSSDVYGWDDVLSAVTMYNDGNTQVTVSNLNEDYDYTVRVLGDREGEGGRYQWNIVNGDSVYVNVLDDGSTTKTSLHENVIATDGIITITASPVTNYGHLNAIEIIVRDTDIDSSYCYYSAFTIPSQVSSSIDTLNKTIAVTMPYGTNVTSLTPSLTVVNGTSSPLTGVAQNFTSPVTYTATALDEVTEFEYTVTVTVQPAPEPTTSTKAMSRGGKVYVRNGKVYKR